ncbi:MAG: hypothetical protein J5563_01325 [Clostridia bacterium]|nr:hypothetical protein [Clostridia bacterium]
MTYPVRNRKTGIILCSAVGFLIAAWISVATVFRLGVALLTAPTVVMSAVLLSLCERYVFSEYSYSAENGRFTVQAHVFNKQTVFFSLTLVEATELLSFAEWKARRKALKKAGETPVYRNMCPDLKPGISKVILFDGNGRTTALRVQLDLKPGELGLQ